MQLITIGKSAIKAVPMVSEGSWGATSIGKHASEMTLYCADGSYFIEWDIPSLDEVVSIGLWFNHKTLTDYDGTFSLPAEAVKLIRKCGFIVPKEFESCN